MPLTVYSAGPEVFLPDAATVFRRKAAICAAHGIVMRAPLDEAVDPAAPDAALRIYRQNRAMMLDCDAIVANLTPFRGPSADDGTAFELGFFDALGRPAFAYSNVAGGLAERTRRFLRVWPDPEPMAIEDFSLPANLMLPHAAETRGGLPIFLPDAGAEGAIGEVHVFARLVAAIAARCAAVPALRQAAARTLGERAPAALRRPLAVLGGSCPLEVVIRSPERLGEAIAALVSA
jgi:nucleoside 2-deoxyribosyltransferase